MLLETRQNQEKNDSTLEGKAFLEILGIPHLELYPMVVTEAEQFCWAVVWMKFHLVGVGHHTA